MTVVNPYGATVDATLTRLTLEQRVAQLACGCRAYERSDVFPTDDSVDLDAFAAAFPHGTGQVGRIGLRRSPDGARQVTSALQEHARGETPGIGLLFNEEGLHGLMAPGATVFPVPIAQASSWDPDLVERIATVTARETRRRGANYVYAPVLDLALDPRWGRIEETFGEDPVLVARLGVAVVHGLQGRPAPGTDPQDAPVPADRVLACAKHFVAHGAPQAGLNGAPVDLGPRLVRDEHLPPFRAAVEAGVGAIMVAYHELDGVPLHVHDNLLTDVLRGELGFRGMISSDGYGVPQLARLHRVATDATDAAERAVRAGLDCEVPEPVGTPGLVERVRSDTLEASVIDRAARAVLGAKARLGLLPGQEPAPPTRDREEDPAALAREAAESGVVLLDNPHGLLPLRRERLHKVLVTGPNAEHAHLGGYCDPSATGVSVLDGLRDVLGPGIEVVHATGCRIGEEPAGPSTWWAPEVSLADPSQDDALLDAAVAAAADVDVVVAVIGGDEATHREGWWFDHLGDRETLTLAGRQDELVERLAATGVPVIAVTISGGPVDLARVAATATAVVWTGYPGEQGGTAIARVLLGDAVPGGHLPVTFPRSVGHVPVRTARRPSAGRGYLHDPATPRYPLGHGLSYAATTVEVSAPDRPTLRVSDLRDGEAFSVDVTVTCEGPREVVELLTLHVTDDVSSVTRPLNRLVDIATLRLPAGAAGNVRLRADRRALSLLDRELQEVVEPGTFTLEVRAASRPVATATVEVVAG